MNSVTLAAALLAVVATAAQAQSVCFDVSTLAQWEARFGETVILRDALGPDGQSGTLEVRAAPDGKFSVIVVGHGPLACMPAAGIRLRAVAPPPGDPS